MTFNVEDLIYLPESDVLKASGMCNVMRNRYWLVHPERGLIFYPFKKSKDIKHSSAQCNSSKEVAEHFHKTMYPWAEIKFIETVIVPISISDYA
jgi:hypothetical protein